MNLKNKKNIIIILILFIIVIAIILSSILITKKLVKEKYEQPEIESLEVFGEKINVDSKRKVYRIFMDSAKIEYNGNGCIPVPYRITFKNGYTEEGGYEYTKNGTDKAYFGIRASKSDSNNTNEIEQSSNKISHIEDYDVYIEVIFDKPLEVASEC